MVERRDRLLFCCAAYSAGQCLCSCLRTCGRFGFRAAVPRVLSGSYSFLFFLCREWSFKRCCICDMLFYITSVCIGTGFRWNGLRLFMCPVPLADSCRSNAAVIICPYICRLTPVMVKRINICINITVFTAAAGMCCKSFVQTCRMGYTCFIIMPFCRNVLRARCVTGATLVCFAALFSAGGIDSFRQCPAMILYSDIDSVICSAVCGSDLCITS